MDDYWRDTEGHPVRKAGGSFVACRCPAQTDGRGHFVYYCDVEGCTAGPVRPPRCDKPVMRRTRGTGNPGDEGYPGQR